MIPEIFRLAWLLLLHRLKRKPKAKAKTKKKPARKKAARTRGTAQKHAHPAPRSGTVHHPRKPHHPKPATHAA